MGTTNYADQLIAVQYFNAATSGIVNHIGEMSRRPGIYDGCYLTKVNDTTVTLSTGDFEIRSTNTQDDGLVRQITVKTQSTENVTVNSSTPYVVWRYTYAAANNTYVDLLAVSSPGASDVVIGKCTYSGATLTGFSYSERTNPDTLYLFGLVQPTSPASMYVRIRSCRAVISGNIYDIADQISPVFVAPTVNPRYDLVVINSSGAIATVTGTESASPAVPSTSGNIVLARIYLTVGMTTIVNGTNIIDARSFLGQGGSAGASYPDMFMLMGA